MTMHNTTLAQALNQALAESMAEDERVILAGQDIGQNGGVFRITEGLWQRFGEKRVQDMPISESFMAGYGIGLALSGLKPVIEFQFMGFIYAGLEQMISHASRMRHRTQGRYLAPVVYRAPYGGGIHAPEHHSESTEALLCHIPGLRVISPSSPKMAYDLLKQAIDCEDPVVFLEPKRLYHKKVTKDNEHYRLGKAHKRHHGEDLTLATWGALTPELCELAKSYHQTYGIGIDLIDLASLQPIDTDTLFASLAQTKRLLIVHEARRSGALGAEIISLALEEGPELKGRPRRLAGLDAIYPYYQREAAFNPPLQEIRQAINDMLLE